MSKYSMICCKRTGQKLDLQVSTLAYIYKPVLDIVRHYDGQMLAICLPKLDLPPQIHLDPQTPLIPKTATGSQMLDKYTLFKQTTKKLP